MIEVAKLTTKARKRTFLSLFSGAGGLDLGFERAGFQHIECVEIDRYCVETLESNRPDWRVLHMDARDYAPNRDLEPDVLLAGVPCQGFSLGGNRIAEDSRNELYKEVVRIASIVKPRIVVIENVLNLRTMHVPGTNRTFVAEIADQLSRIGYSVMHDFFRVSHFGVPQTRRRFLFVAMRDGFPPGYHFPSPDKEVTIRPFLYDLAQNDGIQLPNHNPRWGFESAVHVQTGCAFDPSEEVIPVRFSRTASDGNPVRSFDVPFPAVDTATVWGWAQGHVEARRFEKDRASGKFIRNEDANVTLWRVCASRLRAFTPREYARLQTFPDTWIFKGHNKRDVQLQIGNAVPVLFAERIAQNLRLALDCLEDHGSFVDVHSKFSQSSLFV